MPKYEVYLWIAVDAADYDGAEDEIDILLGDRDYGISDVIKIDDVNPLAEENYA